MRGNAMPGTTEATTFDKQLEEALKVTSDEAADAMIARGRFITYRERDTSPGHVVREYPDGTKTIVEIDLAAAQHSA